MSPEQKWCTFLFFVIVIVFMSNFQLSGAVVTEEVERLFAIWKVDGSIPSLTDHMSRCPWGRYWTPHCLKCIHLCLIVCMKGNKQFVDLAEKKCVRVCCMNVCVRMGECDLQCTCALSGQKDEKNTIYTQSIYHLLTCMSSCQKWSKLFIYSSGDYCLVQACIASLNAFDDYSEKSSVG